MLLEKPWRLFDQLGRKVKDSSFKWKSNDVNGNIATFQLIDADETQMMFKPFNVNTTCTNYQMNSPRTLIHLDGCESG